MNNTKVFMRKKLSLYFYTVKKKTIRFLGLPWKFFFNDVVIYIPNHRKKNQKIRMKMDIYVM